MQWVRREWASAQGGVDELWAEDVAARLAAAANAAGVE